MEEGCICLLSPVLCPQGQPWALFFLKSHNGHVMNKTTVVCCEDTNRTWASAQFHSSMTVLNQQTDTLRRCKWTKILVFLLIEIIEYNLDMRMKQTSQWLSLGLDIGDSLSCRWETFPFSLSKDQGLSHLVKFINPHKGHTCKWPFAHSLLPRVMQSPMDSRLLPSLVTENTSPSSLHGEEPLKDTDKSLAISSQ